MPDLNKRHPSIVDVLKMAKAIQMVNGGRRIGLLQTLIIQAKVSLLFRHLELRI